MHSKVLRMHASMSVIIVHLRSRLGICGEERRGGRGTVLAAGPRDGAIRPIALPSVFHSPDRLAAARTISRDTDLRISIPSRAEHK